MLLTAGRLIGEAPELARHLGEAEFEIARAPHRFEPLAVPLPLSAPGEQGGRRDENEGEGCAGEEDLAQAENLAADLE
jgi:hypothetical protein